MHTHESGDVLALQAETEVEHQALVRLCSILSTPDLRYPAPEWKLPAWDGLDETSHRDALLLPDGGAR
ncbi:hypothetical protein [Halolamina salina]|uniref:Uncharacterized protein n=1 Tax=Halolamina salina TaxID=1220023 RepID=A0ABD6B9W8_9EURY